MAQQSSQDTAFDPEKQNNHQEYHDTYTSSLTHAPTVSDHGEERSGDRHPENLKSQQPGDEDEARQRGFNSQSYMTPSESRAQATRLMDDLAFLEAERKASNQGDEISRSRSNARSEQIKDDAFNPTTEQQPGLPSAIAAEPSNKLHGVLKRLRKLPRILRYFLYMLPVTLILLTPVLLGLLLDERNQPVIGGTGGVQLLWFGIWLEVVWLSLWAARICTAILPFVMRIGAKIVGSGNPKKWKAVGNQMELHTALFLWMLAVLVSYHPILDNHKKPGPLTDPWPEVKWISIVYKIILSFFILAVLNFVEKILIQWIANSFHKRTYSDRIETNKQYIAYLVHLYTHSADRLEGSVYGGSGSGVKTPLRAFQMNARSALNKAGDVANRVVGDFTGREVRLSNHPRKLVTELLRNTSTAQVLARRLFRAYTQDGSDVLLPADLSPAFPTAEDAETAFAIFDRDLNGDVSIEELEAFCDEVHREKKAIAASLKDLDSVIKKLDQTFVVIVVIIAIIVFISILSPSASAALASAGTVVLGLAWVLQATAQEFLQSIIFVFVKHPFDVGDRVTVYGNTGDKNTGDDYYVTEISMLYTEFKKMQGHIVQAPNSVLNTLFILNHRRSGQLADVFTLRMKHGTPREHIEELQARMSEYVLEHRRDFTSQIITEMTSIEDAYCVSVNIICFHKSSFQNELLRLTRHNKFALELMTQMVNIGIEQPRRQYQISGRDFPVYQTNIQPPSYTEDFPSLDHSKLSATRRQRSNSRPTETPTDFYQDVFNVRKQQGATFAAPPRIPETEEEAAEASGIRLERLNSMASGRHSQRGNSNRAPGLFQRTMTLRRSIDQNSNHRGSRGSHDFV